MIDLSSSSNDLMQGYPDEFLTVENKEVSYS